MYMYIYRYCNNYYLDSPLLRQKEIKTTSIEFEKGKNML